MNIQVNSKLLRQCPKCFAVQRHWVKKMGASATSASKVRVLFKCSKCGHPWRGKITEKAS